MRNLLILITVIVLVTQSVASAVGNYDAHTGYRIDNYRHPINRELDIGQTIESESELQRIISAGALLVDVAPIPQYLWLKDLNTWQLPDDHLTIPGAIWLPNVGRGVLDRQTSRYLKLTLEKYATKDRAIIVFCFEDCWMSWNAVRRISELGYREVFWYPKGVTGRHADQLRSVTPELFLY